MDSDKKPTLYVCTNFRPGMKSSCAARGSNELLALIRAEAKARNLDIIIDTIVCLGECEKGPNMRYGGCEIIKGVGKGDITAVLDSAQLPAKG